MIDNKELMRLGALTEQFNDAVIAYLEKTHGAAEKVQETLEQNPQIEDDLIIYLTNLIQSAQAIDNVQDPAAEEEHKALMAVAMIAFVNSFMTLVQKAGLEDDIALLFPWQGKTQDTADAFDRAYAPNIARLCLK